MCARALSRKVWGFAVSLVEEGIELRRAGIEAPIVVLGCYYGLSHRDVVAYRLTPVIGDVRDLARFVRAAEDLGSVRLDVHVKLDTGMSRLGIRPERLDELIAALKSQPALVLGGVCSHLADADGPEPERSEEQQRLFVLCQERMQRAGLPLGIVHLANTAGALRFPSAQYDLVRPGIGLYGVAPSHTGLVGLWPVLSLRTRIIALRDLPPGTGVSYGSRAQTARNTRIATLPIGYADGYSRRMSGRAQVLIAGRRCPVMGPITMDMTMVDVTDVPAVQLGTEAVLIGAQTGSDGRSDEPITLEELSGWSDTIPYEACCALSKRVPRIYPREASATAALS